MRRMVVSMHCSMMMVMMMVMMRVMMRVMVRVRWLVAICFCRWSFIVFQHWCVMMMIMRGMVVNVDREGFLILLLWFMVKVREVVSLWCWSE